jgi:hypothetical protein
MYYFFFLHMKDDKNTRLAVSLENTLGIFPYSLVQNFILAEHFIRYLHSLVLLGFPRY